MCIAVGCYFGYIVIADGADVISLRLKALYASARARQSSRNEDMRTCSAARRQKKTPHQAGFCWRHQARLVSLLRNRSR